MIGGIGGPVPEKPSVFIHIDPRVCKQKRAVVHMFCSVPEKSFLHETSPVWRCDLLRRCIRFLYIYIVIKNRKILHSFMPGAPGQEKKGVYEPVESLPLYGPGAAE